MRGRVDLTSRNVLFSLPLSINLSLLPPSRSVFVSVGVTLKSLPFFLFPPHWCLFFHICISLHTLSLNVFFFFHLFDLSVKSVREPAVRSPCCNDDRLNCSVEMTPELSGCGPFSLSPLTSSLISPHSVASFHLWKSIPAVVKVKEGLKSTRSKCWSLKKN